jgi:N-terminal acetyltransferase B complex non-catalytic subunit
MARYPTFEEYQKKGNYTDGLKRVDDFLKKNPTDVQLLTLKLQFISATHGEQAPVLDQLLAIQPPIQDLQEIINIEEAVISSQKDEYPPSKTVGSQVSKLWETAFKSSSSMNHKLDILSLRFSRAIINNRLADAQQSLIQLKVLQPKNRVLYFAHAAVTQLLSTSKDDVQARLALGLARKAVKEGFDAEQGLDCRVPGQIFAVHGVESDLDRIVGGRFGESKQVYDALRRRQKRSSNGVLAEGEVGGLGKAAVLEPLQAQVEEEKMFFKELIRSEAKTEDVVAFTAKAIRLFNQAYKASTDDRRRVKADACFVAISGLVRAFEQTKDTSYLLTSAYLAERLVQAHEHIHEARTILVYLYMRAGLGSLAIRMFESLRVKEIQHDTVGHALFTRLSLAHPFGTGPTKKDTIEPFKKASKALEVYIRSEEKLAESEAGILSHGQTGMIFDLQELRDSLRTSLARRIIHLEQRRLDRMLHSGYGQDITELGPRVTANWIAISDNRDFAATFDYGYNVENVIHGNDKGVPGEQWVLYALATDAAWCLSCGKEAPVNDVETLLGRLQPPELDIDRLHIDTDGASEAGMYNSEHLAGNLACHVLKLLVDLRSDEPKLNDKVEAVRLAIEKLDMKGLVEAEHIFPERLVDCYAFIDVLKVVVKACGSVRERASGHEKEIEALRVHARKAFEEIQRCAQDQMTKVAAGDVKALMRKEESISDAIADFGSGSLDKFCESIAASAREGWEGVAKIKLA